MVDIGKLPDKEYSMPSRPSLHSIIGDEFLISNILEKQYLHDKFSKWKEWKKLRYQLFLQPKNITTMRGWLSFKF